MKARAATALPLCPSRLVMYRLFDTVGTSLFCTGQPMSFADPFQIPGY